MASIIKANKLQDFAGNDILSSDGAGVITPNASGIKMTPAFEAFLSSNQSVSDNTLTKVQFDTEVFDTDGAYDNSSNYRFTPQTAGKYDLFATIRGFTSSGDYNSYSIQLRKNNSAIGRSDLNMSSNVLGGGANVTIPISIVADANGSSDYFDVYFSANNSTFKAEAGTATNFFGYKIIGA